MAKVTQDFYNRLMPTKTRKFLYLLALFILALVLYTRETYNINIEKKDWNMPRSRAPQGIGFLEYPPHIDKHGIKEIFS